MDYHQVGSKDGVIFFRLYEHLEVLQAPVAGATEPDFP